MNKLYAIVDDGEMMGDSEFYCPTSRIEYHEGMTITEIREAFLREEIVKLKTEDWENPVLEELEEEIREMASHIKVAWVVTQQIIDALENSAPECGNDSAVYTVNRTMKGMASNLCSKTIRSQS